jgi:hypothetical protein
MVYGVSGLKGPYGLSFTVFSSSQVVSYNTDTLPPVKAIFCGVYNAVIGNHEVNPIKDCAPSLAEAMK